MAFKPYCKDCNTWHTETEGHRVLINHILPEKCPSCGEVVRNDMALLIDPKTRQRLAGHVQFSCNYEVEISKVDAEPAIIRECRKGKIGPNRGQ